MRLPARGPAAEAGVRRGQPGGGALDGRCGAGVMRWRWWAGSRGTGSPVQIPTMPRTARGTQRRCCTTGGSSAATASGRCRTTACSTRSGTSTRVRPDQPLYRIGGVDVAVTVCEDAWVPGGPVADAARAGAALVVNLNASPFHRGKHAERMSMARRRVAESGLPFVYLNLVGGQDDLVFDGGSVIVVPDGSEPLLIAQAPRFDTCELVVDVPVAARVEPGPDTPGGDEPRPTRPRRRRCGRRGERGRRAAGAGDLGRGPLPARNGGRAADPGGPGGGLGRARARRAGLRHEERLRRGRDRLVRRGRFVDRRGHRRRRPRRSAGARRAHAVAVLQRPLRRRRGRAVRAVGDRSSDHCHRVGPRRTARPARTVVRRSSGGSDRGEPPVPHPWTAADGAVQQVRLARAHHRQPQRDRRGLLDAVRRHRRRTGGDQGRPQAVGLRTVLVAQRACRSCAHPRVGPHQGAVGRAPSGPARRPEPSRLRRARPAHRRLRRRGPHRGGARPWRDTIPTPWSASPR